MKLILIHGRGQQDFEEDLLKEKWINDLKVGLQKSGLTLPKDVEVEFPYYGKTLIKLMGEAESPLTLIEARRSSTHKINESKKIAFYEAFLSEIARNIDSSQDEKFELKEIQAITRGPQDWDMVHEILKFIDKKQVLGTLPLDLFTKDVFMYLTNRTIKTQINEFIESVFDNEPCVVVGHSLGSIVSYLVLKNNPLYNVKKFITIGSPLGVSSIREYLEQPLEMPKCVKNGWFNAFDKRDIVSLYPLDKAHFNIYPSIENYDNVDNYTANRHSIEGYLNDETVAKKIYDGLVS